MSNCLPRFATPKICLPLIRHCCSAHHPSQSLWLNLIKVLVNMIWTKHQRIQTLNKNWNMKMIQSLELVEVVKKGRKGEYIKKMCEETRARIKILDGPPGTAERAVMVSAKEEPDASLPPAVDGLLRVHKRIVDGLEGDSSHAPPVGSKVSSRLLVPAAQAGSLIGKQGATVKSIQEASNCIVRVLGTDDLPIFALQDDRIVEVVGEPAGVHKAIELIASHLRKFLVDRSIIPLFETNMQMPNPQMEHMPHPQMEHMPASPIVGSTTPSFSSKCWWRSWFWS
ncbi:hypothetical protein F0562_029530 [Nyssa sinensis]|uniref:K Homology domain-containing protein n=1 Tax=Nyssa sinensis TaxID=561372 RepID=A0A5J5B5B1_9ASTE|nr:hypothetical protein F0562_029530 [Nyssa sinensis]